VRRIQVEMESDYKVDPASVTVLATGGLAPVIVGESETITEHVPDLTLLGLRLVYLRTASRATRAPKPARPGPRQGGFTTAGSQ
jgi:type III pantothenate kinase